MLSCVASAGILLGADPSASLGAGAITNSPPSSREGRVGLSRTPSTVSLPALPAAAAPSNSLPELLLTGIVEFSGKKWAMLLLAERGQAIKQYTLKEGESRDGFEVVAIDARAEKVTVRNAGTEIFLTFKANGRPAAEHAWAAERQFVEAHSRAHELREERERERIARERAEAEITPFPFQPSPGADDPVPDSTGAPLRHPPIHSVTFSPDGTRVVKGVSDASVRVWDPTTGRPVGERPAR